MEGIVGKLELDRVEERGKDRVKEGVKMTGYTSEDVQSPPPQEVQNPAADAGGCKYYQKIGV
jgi:hypothetical protein